MKNSEPKTQHEKIEAKPVPDDLTLGEDDLNNADQDSEMNRETRRNIFRKVSSSLSVTDLGFYLLYGLIGMQIGLEALGARDWSGFKQFLDQVTAPFLNPFKGLVTDPQIEGHQVMLSFIVALIVYRLIQLALKRIVAVVLQATGITTGISREVTSH